MFFSMKNTILHSPPLQTPTQSLTPSSPPSTATGGHHEPPLLAANPPHQEEYFIRSGILRIHLKDTMEKIPSILSFVASLRLDDVDVENGIEMRQY
ncbi:hypothetical protein HKD37_20G055982 [Glycine soja]